MPEEDLVELKFRLYDGSDIGPIRYSPASTVAMLKERIVADWPRDKKIIPKAANDVKLISAGKILENNKTIAQCRVPFGELPGGVITMHVVVQPSLAKTKTGWKSQVVLIMLQNGPIIDLHHPHVSPLYSQASLGYTLLI
ncbi:membrane-anchored ubiquitin-fold protein 3-like isoform X1 [Magnolia sinica]|uniref:membrane-anchored ubiquitin-fold protein 3-like isoform X1 n=1 Tax=Magnolia sinica TaxID=86752 RepID=UPI00265A54A6|nr:membrane-anchored ubiquitin-fold protein 3-like isoform X1 [Magnolia sinica]